MTFWAVPNELVPGLGRGGILHREPGCSAKSGAAMIRSCLALSAAIFSVLGYLDVVSSALASMVCILSLSGLVLILNGWPWKKVAQ